MNWEKVTISLHQQAKKYAEDAIKESENKNLQQASIILAVSMTLQALAAAFAGGLINDK